MAWTSAWKFSGALPGNGRLSSGTQTYIFIHKTCYFFPAFGFAAMPGKCPGCIFPMKAQMWDLVAGYLQQRCVQGKKLLVLVTVPFLHRAMHVGPQPIPCSLPAATQLKLITYQEYQHSHKACAGWRRRLSLSPFFPFRPAWLVLWQSPRTWKGGAEGGLGGQQLPELTHGLILICSTACSFPLHRCCWALPLRDKSQKGKGAWWGGKRWKQKRAAFIKLFFFQWKEAFISDFICHVRCGSLPISKDANKVLTSYTKYRAVLALGE